MSFGKKPLAWPWGGFLWLVFQSELSYDFWVLDAALAFCHMAEQIALPVLLAFFLIADWFYKAEFDACKVL